MGEKGKEIIVEERYLRDHKDFIKVDNIHYGGYQDWLFSEGYISKYWSNRSCGVIAASNTLLYMSRFANRIEGSKEYTITKEGFVDFALYLYKFIRPRFYGIPTVAVMINGIKKYAKKMNFEIVPFILENPNTKLEVIRYIKRGLSRNYPIMMVTWNTSIKDLKNHWVTITGYYSTKSGDHYILTSNWGKEEVFSLDQWLDEKSFYKGLVYFRILETVEK